MGRETKNYRNFVSQQEK